MIGVQMASAYLGSCCAPPVYGLIANHVSQSLLPAYLSIFLVLMFVLYEITLKMTTRSAAPKNDGGNNPAVENTSENNA